MTLAKKLQPKKKEPSVKIDFESLSESLSKIGADQSDNNAKVIALAEGLAKNSQEHSQAVLNALSKLVDQMKSEPSDEVGKVVKSVDSLSKAIHTMIMNQSTPNYFLQVVRDDDERISGVHILDTTLADN